MLLPQTVVDGLSTMAVDEPRPGIALITLDRPKQLNALTFASFGELRRVVEALEAHAATRVVVVTGRGRGFCSGLDLGDAAKLGEMSVNQMLAEQKTWADGIASLRLTGLPVIAAVNGPAAGAGLGLALAADIRLAARSARFNAAFVRIGLSGGDVGVSWMLPRIVGLARAAEIMLTGRPYDADESARIGLVNAVHDDDELLDAALDLAQMIAGNSPLGMRLTKQVLQTNVDAPSLPAALELENRNQVLASRTEDMSEALQAFLERRPARFHDR
jgi:enoyl-CoA hydratase/carnithine racemase